MNTTQTARQKLTAKIESRTTAQLLDMFTILEAKWYADGTLAKEENIVRIEIARVIGARHGISERVNEIYLDDEAFEGTEGDAIRMALSEAGVAA